MQMVVLDILSAFLTQVVAIFGVIIVFGFLIALCNKLFYLNTGSLGIAVCYLTGFIGTPIHELSHALFCVIFGHKIHEIKLFQISPEDGTLGYVRHSYSPKNIYQRVGCFFIGVAPILVISVLLFWLSKWLMPGLASMVFNGSSGIYENFGIGAFKTVGHNLIEMLKYYYNSPQTAGWWVFLILSAFLALHMTLSGADIKNAWKGLPNILGMLFAADIVLGLVSGAALSKFTGWCLVAGQFLIGFMSLALLISLILALVTLVIGLIATSKSN